MCLGHRLNGNYAAKGRTVTVEVSPMSWTVKDYGFQVEYRTPDGRSWGVLRNPALTRGRRQAAEVQALLDALEESPCSNCGHYHYVTGNINRGALCEKCFAEGVNAPPDRAVVAAGV